MNRIIIALVVVAACWTVEAHPEPTHEECIAMLEAGIASVKVPEELVRFAENKAFNATEYLATLTEEEKGRISKTADDFLVEALTMAKGINCDFGEEEASAAMTKFKGFVELALSVRQDDEEDEDLVVDESVNANEHVNRDKNEDEFDYGEDTDDDDD